MSNPPARKTQYEEYKEKVETLPLEVIKEFCCVFGSGTSEGPVAPEELPELTYFTRVFENREYPERERLACGMLGMQTREERQLSAMETAATASADSAESAKDSAKSAEESVGISRAAAESAEESVGISRAAAEDAKKPNKIALAAMFAAWAAVVVALVIALCKS